MKSFSIFSSFSSIMVVLFLLLTASAAHAYTQTSVRVKDLARVAGVRDNALSGYGIVVGLAGTGDSSRSRATLQSVANTLRSFGVNVPVSELNSRNVAAVMITTQLPAFSQSGQKLDINVSSLGDSRSLVGGTLLLAPLKGADGRIYALAQGPVSIGGFKYDMFGNMVQKNHPTVGVVAGGATVERIVETDMLNADGKLDLVLHEADFTTAGRLAQTINRHLNDKKRAKAVHAGLVRIDLYDFEQEDIVSFIQQLESLRVVPDQRARVVVNERTGTVVSGGDVKLSEVTITQGELRVSIVTDYRVSQPSLVADTGDGVRTVVAPDTSIDVTEGGQNLVSLPAGTTVGDLVSAMNKIKTTTRDIIIVLQSIKRAGALHAELVIQ